MLGRIDLSDCKCHEREPGGTLDVEAQENRNVVVYIKGQKNKTSSVVISGSAGTIDIHDNGLWQIYQYNDRGMIAFEPVFK